VKTLPALLVALLWLTPSPLPAWNSNGHSRLSKLAFDDGSGQACFDEFAAASDDPDAVRKQKPWLFYTHANDRETRAVNAFNASLRIMIEAAKTDSDARLCDAARQYAHSFHYVQDMADPTKEFPWSPFLPALLPFQRRDPRPHDYHEYCRDEAERLLSVLVGELQSGHRTSVFWKHLETERKIFRRLDFPHMFVRLNEARKLGGERLVAIQKQRLAGPRNPEYGRAIFENQMLYSLAVIVAAERRMNDMLLEGGRNAAHQ